MSRLRCTRDRSLARHGKGNGIGKKIACGILVAAAAFMLLPRTGPNKNFVPDWTFRGSSLVGAFWAAPIGARRMAKS